MKRKTREMTKRLLAFFLAFVMVYTSSGMTVLAEGMEETVVESVASEDAVEVLKYSTEVASEVVDTSAENTQEEQKTSEESTEEVQAQPTETVEDTSKETVEEASKEQTEAAGNVSAEPTEESGGVSTERNDEASESSNESVEATPEEKTEASNEAIEENGEASDETTTEVGDASNETIEETEQQPETSEENDVSEGDSAEEREENQESEETQAVQLSTKVNQEVISEDTGYLVKYTLVIQNEADVDRDNIVVKAVLGNHVAYEVTKDCTGGMSYINDISSLPEGIDFDEMTENDFLQKYQSALIWDSQTVEAWSTVEYVFYAKVAEGTTSTEDIDTVFSVNGEKIAVENIQWINSDLLKPIEEEKVDVKRTYTYSDSNIKVVATLEYATAVPDEAEFRVTPVTANTSGYNYEAYMQALNNNANAIAENNDSDVTEYTSENTLLYDIAFIVDKTDEDGNVIEGEKVEYQPAEGTVSFTFTFKNKQLENGIEVETNEDISIIHLPLEDNIKETVDSTAEATNISASDVQVEIVDGNVSLNNSTDKASFTLNNLSLVGFVGVVGQALEPGTHRTYRDILGDAVYYGIVANGITLGAHMDTNFATSSLSMNCNRDITAGKYTSNNNGGLYIIAEKNDSNLLQINGYGVNVWCTEEDSSKIDLVNTASTKIYASKSTLDGYVNSMLNHVKSESASMAAEKTYVVNSVSDQNSAEIDLTECDRNATYYISLKELLQNTQLGGIKIKKYSDQTIVFNYIDSDDISLGQFYVNDLNSSISDATIDASARTVIFNMPNATNVYINSGICGVIIAPNAVVSIGSTSSGWLIAKEVKNPGGEWHNVWGEMPKLDEIPVPVTLSAVKTVNGKTPTSEEVFSFVLEKGSDSGDGWSWISLQTKTNNGKKVSFDDITYIEEGTYYYRISEATASSTAYTYDTTKFIVKIDVEKNVVGTTTTYKIASIKYYKADDLAGVTDENIVSQASFNNMTVSETTDVQVKKVWDDADNQDGKRPDSIQVQLYADGEKSGEEVELNAGNNWTYTWSDLAQKKSGKTIAYTVEEASKVNGYSVTTSGNDADGFVITNTHTPETTSVSGTKTWDDAENQDGVRPSSITVNLYANGEFCKSQSVMADAKGEWKYSFTDLPKYKAGKELTYSVGEVKVEGYTFTVSGYNIKNTHIPSQTSVTVTKEWDDNGNQDGIRPDSIQVQLYADGVASREPVTLNATNDWTYTWTELAEKTNGKAIDYTVVEVTTSVITGTDGAGTYSYTVSGRADKGYTITNTHTPETTSVSGTKTWDDAENQDGVRPSSITVRLYADGKEVVSKTVTADDNWKYSFTNLAKYAGGKEIIYTVSEDAVPDYSTTVSGYDIKNSYTPGKTSVTVTKAWSDGENQDGIRPSSVKVQLYADGEKSGEEVELNAGNNWTYTWSDLAQKKSGKTIAYTVKEAGKVNGYSVTTSGNAADGFVITNTHTPETTSVSGTKTWDDAENQDGVRPSSITVNLLANGEKVDSVTVTADSDGNWKYSFTNLPVYKEGQKITYTVTEDAVENYATEIDGYNITNSYTPGKTSVTVTKAWSDEDNQDGIRPSSVKVQLYADGGKSGEEVELNAGNNWTYTWTGLDIKKSGKTIVYTVKEADEVSGYSVTTSGNATEGYTITNTHTPETTSVSGTKTWDDAENQDGVRPSSITVNLYANGEKVDSVTVTADDNWKYSFTNLAKYEGGKEIIYTVSEDAVENYATEIDGYNIKNSYTPGKTSVTVTKAWSDGENQDGIRPSSVKVQLYADGTVSGEVVELTEANNWTNTWTELDVYRDGGIKIEYTVDEVETPAGYEKTITGDATTGYTITNSHIPVTTEVSGTKIWDDHQDSKRPTSITVRLWADEKEVASKEVTKADNWTYSFAELPVYQNGKEIVYSITEDGIDGYVTTIDEFDITNTITSVKIAKVDIADGKELEGATIQVIDSEGNVVDEWVSTKEAHEITGLKTGENYTLKETVAPEGYTVTTETTFELNADGTINKEKTSTKVSGDSILLVEDAAIAEETYVEVTKKLTYDGEMIYAVDQTFYVALYYDEACTQLASEVQKLEFVNCGECVVAFDNLGKDIMYYVSECDEDGNATGYGTLATGEVYISVFEEGNSFVVEEGDTTTVYFENEFYSFPDGFYKIADLSISKTVLGVDGNEKNSDEVFYAGIFSDPNYTVLSDDVEENIIELDMSGCSEIVTATTVRVPLEGETITLYITEVDEDGNPVSDDKGFMYNVTIDNKVVTIDSEHLEAAVKIVNQEKEKTPEKEKTKDVKTGDNTPVLPYAAGAVASMVAMIWAAIYGTKRRKRNTK